MRNTMIAMVGLLVVAASARADGFFVWRNERVDIQEPEQKAIILFDRGLEDLVLEVRYEGAPEDFGWIVPLPSRPRIRVDHPSLFVDLSRMTQDAPAPRSRRTSRLRSMSGATIGQVGEIQRARVGIYDAAVIEAPDGKSLTAWLQRNGFRMPRGAGPMLAEYARRHWVFVALRIAPGHSDSSTRAALASGTVQPIRFRFTSHEPVYPLRVSALGRRPSQVLLYVITREPVVHRTCDRVRWIENACGPLQGWNSLDPDSAFPALAGGQGYITKLRATLAPGQMEDLYFHPYDPMPGLAGSEERQRLEAIAYLGWRKPPGADDRLTAFLRARHDEDRESTTALWALGEIGGDRAIAELRRHAERGSPFHRLEAIEALANLRAAEAFPIYLRALAPRRDDFGGRDDRWQERYVVEACFEHLVEQGDSTCIAPLRRRLGEGPWDERLLPGFEATHEERILAALAAAGDRAARDTIVRRLVAGRDLTTPEALRRSIGRRGTINDFPSGFWPAVHLLHGNAFGGWRDLDVWHALLAGRPEVHDQVLRRAAADPTMTDLGRTLLLGLLSHTRSEDAGPLLDYARRGLVADSLMVTLSANSIPKAGVPVRYNVPVCTAAYALGRHRAVDALLALWQASPRSDHQLRGELAAVLSGIESEAVVPAVMDYVRSEWNTRAASPDYARGVIASANDRLPSALTRAPFDWDFRGIDIRYRALPITSLITSRSRPDSLVSLVTDATLSPWLRVYWAVHVPAYDRRMRPWLPAIRRGLDELAASAAADSNLQLAIDGARRKLAIGDQVYADHAWRTEVEWK